MDASGISDISDDPPQKPAAKAPSSSARPSSVGSEQKDTEDQNQKASGSVVRSSLGGSSAISALSSSRPTPAVGEVDDEQGDEAADSLFTSMSPTEPAADKHATSKAAELSGALSTRSSKASLSAITPAPSSPPTPRAQPSAVPEEEEDDATEVSNSLLGNSSVMEEASTAQVPAAKAMPAASPSASRLSDSSLFAETASSPPTPRKPPAATPTPPEEDKYSDDDDDDDDDDGQHSNKDSETLGGSSNNSSVAGGRSNPIAASSFSAPRPDPTAKGQMGPEDSIVSRNSMDLSSEQRPSRPQKPSPAVSSSVRSSSILSGDKKRRSSSTVASSVTSKKAPSSRRSSNSSTVYSQDTELKQEPSAGPSQRSGSVTTGPPPRKPVRAPSVAPSNYSESFEGHQEGMTYEGQQDEEEEEERHTPGGISTVSTELDITFKTAKRAELDATPVKMRSSKSPLGPPPTTSPPQPTSRPTSAAKKSAKNSVEARPEAKSAPMPSPAKQQQAPPPPAAPTSYSVDDSWEGELHILPPTLSPPVELPTDVDQPRVRRDRPNSARSSTGGSSMTSASVVGALVGPPAALAARARPTSAPRARPSSAATRDREAAVLVDALARSPATWDVRDVSAWVQMIGMGQYRSKFTHNCVDGRLLMAMTEEHLKIELGVGPMGHRAMILDQIQALAAHAAQAGQEGFGTDSPMRPGTLGRPHSACLSSTLPLNTGEGGARRPASASRGTLNTTDAYLGPASGRVTVYEQRNRLLFELDRAAARASQHRALADQVSNQATLSGHQVAHYKGLIADLERKNAMAVTGTAGGIDAQGRVPWRPPSPHMQACTCATCVAPGAGSCASTPGVYQSFTCMSRQSRKLLSQTFDGQGHMSTFLDRLESDVRKRDRSRVDLTRKYFSQEAIFNDPMLAQKAERRDLTFVNHFLQERSIRSEPLPADQRERDAALAEVVEQNSQSWGLPDSQVRGIVNARGVKKVALLSSALRTQLFMQRYDNEDAQRRSGSKAKELQTKHWDPVCGKPQAQKTEEDLGQSAQHFAKLGWVGEDAITDERLASLLKRAVAAKLAYAKYRDQLAAGLADATAQVDWASSVWAADGLGALQADVVRKSAAAAEVGAAAAVGPIGVAKTSHAPPGTVTVGPGATTGLDWLAYTVNLLAQCRSDDLAKMEALSGARKQLGVYRVIRTQQFLEFTESEIRSKEAKLKQVYDSMLRPKRVLSKEEANSFYERLQDDAGRRRATTEKMAADKMEKEQKILASSAMYGQRNGSRPKSAR